MCVCVCVVCHSVCVCVCARAHARARECVGVCMCWCDIFLALNNSLGLLNKCTNTHFPQLFVDLLLSLNQDLRVGGQMEDGEGDDSGRGVKASSQEQDGVGLDLVIIQS